MYVTTTGKQNIGPPKSVLDRDKYMNKHWNNKYYGIKSDILKESQEKKMLPSHDRDKLMAIKGKTLE
jgi:hypothetical protein